MHMCVDKCDEFFPLISAANIKPETHLRFYLEAIVIKHHLDARAHRLMGVIMGIPFVSKLNNLVVNRLQVFWYIRLRKPTGPIAARE